MGGLFIFCLNKWKLEWNRRLGRGGMGERWIQTVKAGHLGVFPTKVRSGLSWARSRVQGWWLGTALDLQSADLVEPQFGYFLVG